MKELYDKIIKAIGLDKILHFFVCAFLALAFGHMFHWITGALLTACLGVMKEYLLDKTVDWKDLLADGLGILAGIGILFI